MDFKDPITNNPFFSFICKAEDFLKGEQLKYAPELYGHFWDSTCFVSTSLNFCALRSGIPYRRTGIYGDFDTCGSHQRDGIYIMSGPNFKNNNGERGRTYSLLDITPTVLYLQSVAIPENFDGRIMIDALAPEYIRRKQIERRTDVDYSSKTGKSEVKADDKQQIMEMLKLLGYLE